MKQSIFFFITLILVSGSSAQQLSKQDERFVDSVMTANYPTNAPGAVLLIAKNGEPVFKKSYGMASVELNVPNKPELVFRIGSMSKQFTAVCILKLAQEGKLNLQDDIKKYLPDYNAHGRRISIENLLTHTSGIIDGQDKVDFITKMRIDQSHDDLLNSFMNDSLLFEPGINWHYSNSNYELAGFIVEKVSGTSLKEYLQKNIFQPLQMFHTYVNNDDSIFINLVNGYDKIAGKVRPAVFLSSTWEYGAGDILSCVEDLLKWDNSLYTDKIIKKEWLEKAWQPFVLKNGTSSHYGFAWSTNKFLDLKVLEHAGGVNGFVSDGIRIPSQHLYIALLSNITSPWSVSVTSAITLQLIRQASPTPIPFATDKKTLEDYPGVYALQRPGGNMSTDSVNGEIYEYLTLKNDTLFVQPPKYGKVPLTGKSHDLFINGAQHYRFHRNGQGKIISVEVYSEPFQTGPPEIRVKTSLPLPKEKNGIRLAAKQLELLRGRYDFGGGAIAAVIVEGDKIYLQMEEKFELFAESETHFFFTAFEGTAEFIEKGGQVTGVIVTRGAKFEGKKIQ